MDREAEFGGTLVGVDGAGDLRQPPTGRHKEIPAQKRNPNLTGRMTDLCGGILRNANSNPLAIGVGEFTATDRDFCVDFVCLPLDRIWMCRHSVRFRKGVRRAHSSSLSVSAETIL